MKTVRNFFCALLAAAVLAGCRDGLADFDAVGTLERDRIELIAEAPEPIAAIEVREGDRVAGGDLLLRLEDTRLAAEVEQAVAARERASARFAELERGPRREDIEAAEARLRGAEATLQRQVLELDRVQNLRKDKVVAQAELDTARAQHDEALARRNEAKAVLDELRAGTRVEEIDQARAAVAEAEAAVAAARVHLQRLEVRAPVDGRVDALPYELGERPPVGAVVAVMLAEEMPYARVYVPEKRRVDVKPGGGATVRVDGVDGELRGRVRTVSVDPSFTPYFALTERDRGHLVYVAEIDLLDERARDLPAGVPVQVLFPDGAAGAARTERNG